MDRITSTTDLGRRNAELVLRRLYDRQAYTNAEIARETDLSRSTVERALELFAKQGLVTKSEPVALVSGRPAALHRLRVEFGYLLALDVGAHTVRARVDDLAGPPAAGAWQPPEPTSVGPRDSADVRLAALEEIAERALAAAGVTREQVYAVTVGTPGIVDNDGVITSSGVIRKDWAGDRLRGRLRDRFPGALVAVDNDANLAVLAEQRFGVAGETPDVVVVHAGRRVGFGIVHGGQLHRGAHHQAGEAANIRDSWWGRASTWLHGHDREMTTMFAAAQAGEPDAIAMVEEFADLLGRAMADIVHTIDPALIVLGGAVSLGGATILNPLVQRFKRACSGMDTPDVLLSTLGRDAVLLGAAAHAGRNAFAHLLDDGPPLPNSAPRRRP